MATEQQQLPRFERNFYVVRGKRTPVVVDDTVLMIPERPRRRMRVAEIVAFEVADDGSTLVRVRWYYRPEETKNGRKEFHGKKEVLRSDHIELQKAERIRSKCTVHSVEDFRELEEVTETDFFCRFDYNATTGEITPDEVSVYCKCVTAYNPDVFVIECAICNELYHPSCIDMTVEEARQLEEYICDDCIAED